MSMWRRILNVFRGDRLNREIDEEFDSHIKRRSSKVVIPVRLAEHLDPYCDGARRPGVFGSLRGWIHFAPTPSSAGGDSSRQR
jgi:hypothetical protein